MKKQTNWSIFTICALVLISCKKEPIGTLDPVVEEVIISGTTWTSIAPDFVNTERVLAMSIQDDNLMTTYVKSNSLSALYNGSTMTETPQFVQAGINDGFEKIETLNGITYGLGYVGGKGLYQYDASLTSNPWISISNVSSDINGLAEFEGKKVVGCSNAPFIRVNSTSNSYTELGNGLNGEVHDVIVFNNKLIAAGNFSLSGSTTVSNIAQWNGVEWLPLATGLNNLVRDLVIYNGKLIALGQFTQAGGVSCPYVGVWDGTSWSTLGTGLSGGFMGGLTGLVLGNQLIIGGDFDAAGSIYSPNIIKWNGSSWESLGGGVQDAIGEICIYHNQLYIANFFEITGSNFLKRLD